MMHRRHVPECIAALALGALLASCDVYDAARLRAGSPGPEPGLCGNGVRDADEMCDTAIEAGQEGACPSACDPDEACRVFQMLGDACQAQCYALEITRALSGDGCCPEGVGPDRDGDCSVCGDKIVSLSESCDPPETCPAQSACKSPDPCLMAVFSGAAETCTASCRLVEIKLCQGGDGCCPAGCVPASDGDCSPSCGDHVIDPAAGETCEAGDELSPCPESCDDGVACTRDVMTGSAKNCNVTCSHIAIDSPASEDGCCPTGVNANANNDSDCAPACGNGVVEGGEACDGQAYCNASCEQIIQPSLVHRYRFDGTGMTVRDSAGGTAARIVDGTLSGSGTVVLGGGTDGAYVDLPNGSISNLTDATIEVWLTWGGGIAWQRAFDFGNNNNGEGSQGGVATTSWFLTPKSTVNDSIRMVMNFTPAPDDYTNDFAVERNTPLTANVRHQLLAVFDDSANAMRLYVDGALAASRTDVTGHLASIDDRNVWIGRSNYNDADLGATIHEVRIYNSALSAAQVLSSYNAGPDP